MTIKFWVVKSEIYNNDAVLLFKDFHTEEQHFFYINKDLKLLKQFLRDNKKDNNWFFGFDILRIEAQILEYIFRTKNATPKSTISNITYSSKYKQETYQQSLLSFNYIDIAAINHWIYGKKQSSLQKIQNNINWVNLSDTIIKNVNLYLENEVSSIIKIIQLSNTQLKIRKFMQFKYNFNCINMSNTTLGTELLLDLYCKKTNTNKDIIRESRTPRNSISVKDIIFPFIKFSTPEFYEIYNKFNELNIISTKNAFNHTISIKGNTIKYGLGGLHQVKKHSVHKSDKDYIILEADVISQHPYIAANNNIFPEHLNSIFPYLLKSEILDPRKLEKHKKDKNQYMIDGLKECALSLYGNSNNPKSWLYDPKFTMQIVINSQLMLSMLIESLLTNIGDIDLLMSNTDGIFIKLLKKDLHIFNRITKYWTKITKLELEITNYSKLFIWDLNNYIAYGDKYKAIGRLQVESFMKNDFKVLHKNKEFLIIPKAINAYFLKGIKPERYINQNNNIYDYCGYKKKLKDGWCFFERYTKNGAYTFKEIKTDIRYYVSKTNFNVVKRHETGKETEILEYHNVKILNNNNIEDYNIDYDYYINKIYEQIKLIEPEYLINDKQLKLF